MLALFSKKTQEQIIAEIHNEFDTAESRILSEAELILRQTDDTILKKAAQLENLGFINSSPVRDVSNLNLVQTREIAGLVKYYQQTYPFQKFITESELERICEKYKLVFAPVANYINDVPQKNIDELRSIPTLKKEDIPLNKLWCAIDYAGFINIGELRAKQFGLPKIIKDKNFSSWIEIDAYLKEKYPAVKGISYIASSGKNYSEERTGLFICAPKSHFKLDGLKKSGKYSFANVFVTEVKDPIVFRYCRGGVQILSKWGLEAQDESLINPITN